RPPPGSARRAPRSAADRTPSVAHDVPVADRRQHALPGTGEALPGGTAKDVRALRADRAGHRGDGLLPGPGALLPRRSEAAGRRPALPGLRTCCRPAPTPTAPSSPAWSPSGSRRSTAASPPRSGHCVEALLRGERPDHRRAERIGERPPVATEEGGLGGQVKGG